ncbi:hypothetical protein ACF1G0_26595 [Streptomyces sp. NPDC013953]|uniref:hypothetical protein n=1 Tax=Streptomyces sp. NPDC013953 TaxID=3364868 RepID=UPI0036F7AAFA
MPGGGDGYRGALLTQSKAATRERIAAMNPRWDGVDVGIEPETLTVWDEATAYGLEAVVGADLLPAGAVVPSLVTLADPSRLVSPEHAALLTEHGFEVRTVPGAGHIIHRDDFAGLAALDGWV